MLCVRACMCVHVQVCVHMCVHVYAHVHACTCVQVCMCVHVCAHVRVCTCVRVYSEEVTSKTISECGLHGMDNKWDPFLRKGQTLSFYSWETKVHTAIFLKKASDCITVPSPILQIHSPQWSPAHVAEGRPAPLHSCLGKVFSSRSDLYTGTPLSRGSPPPPLRLPCRASPESHLLSR